MEPQARNGHSRRWWALAIVSLIAIMGLTGCGDGVKFAEDDRICLDKKVRIWTAGEVTNTILSGEYTIREVTKQVLPAQYLIWDGAHGNWVPAAVINRFASSLDGICVDTQDVVDVDPSGNARAI